MIKIPRVLNPPWLNWADTPVITSPIQGLLHTVDDYCVSLVENVSNIKVQETDISKPGQVKPKLQKPLDMIGKPTL